MEKPLWNFFLVLKNKIPYSLSVDQYEYFLLAFSQMRFNHFQTWEELRDYSKIFWLKDFQYEEAYNTLFKKFVDWEKVLKKLVEKNTETEVVDDDVIIDPPPPMPPPPKRTLKSSQPTNPLNKEADKIDFAEFNLVINEETGSVQKEHALIETPEHSFLLSDNHINPFPLRYFAQRLRRAVQNPVKELTNSLNFEKIINGYVKNNYIEKIIYQTKDSSKSNIVLLSDQHGSMLAYEYLAQHLSIAIKSIPDCTFEHYTFYNLPKTTANGQHYLLNNQLEGDFINDTSNHPWQSTSWFFIFSDAGAHSDSVNFGRLKATLKMWRYFSSISSHVYWLNPVPIKYMQNSTAKRLQTVIPMVYPITKNLNQFFNHL